MSRTSWMQVRVNEDETKKIDALNRYFLRSSRSDLIRYLVERTHEQVFAQGETSHEGQGQQSQHTTI